MNNTFTIETDAFEGPLEVLLNLIESRKLSISEISLAEVTDGYLAYVEKLPELPLGETAQFILVASTLLLIKSRSLLPSVDLTDEETYSIEELERRLKQYAVYRAAAKLLRAVWGTRPYTFPRRAPERRIVFSPGETTPTLLLSRIRSLIDLLPKPDVAAKALIAPVLKLEEVIEHVRTRLTSALRTKFSEFTNAKNRHEVIVYFLAMLELVRSGSISATQEQLFSDIHLEAESTGGVPKYGA